MWKCTLVLFYYLSTLLSTTFISLSDSTAVNFTISATTATSSSPAANDGGSLDTIYKIVGIVSGIFVVIVAILGLLTLKKRELLCFRKQRGKPRLHDELETIPLISAEDQELPDENVSTSPPTESPHLDRARTAPSPTESTPQPIKTVTITAPDPAVLLVKFDMETEKPDVLWYIKKADNLKPIPDIKKYIKKTEKGYSQLTIDPTVVEDSKEYTCIVSNDKGEDQRKINLKVQALQECATDNVENPLDFKEIKASLKTKYDESQKYLEKTLPGEDKFQLNHTIKEQFMPLSYGAEQLQDESTFIEYKGIACNIEELIKKLVGERNKSRRIAQCTADAGYGKTIFANQLTHQWLYDLDGSDPYLKDIELIITIPIRNVDPKATLADMIGNGEKGLKYFDQNTAKSIEHYLKNEPNQKCLVIIDGVDEKDIPEDSELYGLITGEICKATKVLVIGRPEAKLYITLEKFSPYYKIKIHGTTEDGAKGYITGRIEEVMNGQGVEESEKELIRNKCTETLNEFKILTIPLYVYLVAIMFNETIVTGASFSDFQVPTTMTELLNAFFRILIRRWANKSPDKKDNDLNENITFKRNPFEEGTTVPINVIEKLYAMAQISYTFLKDKRFTFSNEDLVKNHVGVEDITLSGLFCQTENGFFYRHKLMQEYMAALSFVHPRCRDKIVNPPKQKETLETIFDGLANVPKFIFGLKPSKGKEIIESLTGHTNMDVSGMEPNIYYEARLCNEARDKYVTEAMVQLLCASQTTDPKFVGKIFSEVHLKFYNHLTQMQVKLLLSNWYNLTVDSKKETKTDQWCHVNGVSGSKHKNHALSKQVRFDKNTNHICFLFLTETLLYLLHIVCRFQKVSSHIHPVPLSMLFPGLQQLHLSLNTKDMLHISENSTIKHISILHFVDICHHFNEILQLSELRTLSIMPQLTDLSFSMCDIKLGKLHTLELYMGRENDEDIKNKQLLLQSLPQLSVLSLNLSNMNTDITFLQCTKGITTLKKLHVFSNDNVCEESWFHIIKGMDQLTDIGIGISTNVGFPRSINVNQSFPKDKYVNRSILLGPGEYMTVADAWKYMLYMLLEVKQISSIEFLYGDSDEAEEEDIKQLLNDLQRAKQRDYPNSQVEVKCTNKYPGYLQPKIDFDDDGDDDDSGDEVDFVD